MSANPILPSSGHDPSFVATYLSEVADIARSLNAEEIDGMAVRLATIRNAGGRLFILGAGGGAGHASHAVNDFRKICDFESYAPSDNVSELTARVNDQGWDVAYREFLLTSRLSAGDALLVFSVGGGSRDPEISMSLVNSMELAQEVGAPIFSIVGRANGVAAQVSERCVVVPAVPDRLTPHTEEFQAVVWHLLVTHPALASRTGTWETLNRAAAL